MVKVRTRTLSAAGLLALTLAFAAANDAKKPTDPPPRLAGTWVFDVAGASRACLLGQVWTSKVTIRADSFAISKYTVAGGEPASGKNK